MRCCITPIAAASTPREQFQELLVDHGIICPISRSGNVWDNAVMESFFYSLKAERSVENVSDTRPRKSRRIRLYRMLLQREARSLDDRLPEPSGVRKPNEISLGCRQPNRGPARCLVPALAALVVGVLWNYAMSSIFTWTKQ
jgi:hypothetical protein